ncbi:MAG: helix-turn-helix domain-containing protein [Caulobacteraceae bacterium]
MQARPISVQQATPPSAGLPGAQPSDELKIIGVTRTFGRDQEIYGQGGPADLAFRVVSGAVRSFRVLADGRRQIDGFYFPGDVFGLDLETVRSSSAEAIGEVVVVLARRSVVMAGADQATRLWRHALLRLRRSQDHLLTLGRRSATERVARFLVDLAERLAGGDDVELPMSRQDIADYLGLTIETVSRTMTQLQADGLIRLNGCRHVRLARRAVLTELCE